MTPIPEGNGAVTTISPNDFPKWQAEGWKVIGVVTESEVVSCYNDVPCLGSAPGDSCSHGHIGGGCSQSSSAEQHVAVLKAKLVIVRDEKTALGEAQRMLIAAKDENGKLLHAKESSEALLKKSGGLIEKAQAEIASKEERVRELEEKMYKLNETIRNQETKYRTQADENREMRTAIHTRAMAEVLGAMELANNREWMHPLAFVAIIDSMERYSTDQEKYVYLIKDLIERNVLDIGEAEEGGGKSIRVMDMLAFNNAVKALDAESRLDDAEAK